MTTLHLVRHGESAWNVERRLQGQTAHVPLTELGRRQARAAAETLLGTRARAVYSSDLVRAWQTAAPIAEVLGLPVRPHPGLRERSYGRLEGLPSAQALALIGAADPDGRLGGGESLRDLRQRVTAAIGECIADAGGGPLVIVSHGDTIRALLDSGPHAPHPANGSITTIDVPS